MKYVIVLVFVIVLLLTGCSSLPKDMEGKGKNVRSRTVEAFEGLQSSDKDKLLLLSYGGLDENEKYFIGSQIGQKVLSYMTFNVEKAKLIEENENVKTCEVTLKIKSIEMDDIIETYEKIAKEKGRSDSGIVNDLLLEAIEMSKDETEEEQVKLMAYLYSDIDVWRINIDKEVFDALFPEYDDYVKWRYSE